MAKGLKVGLRGFSEKDLEKFERIFQTTGGRDRSYCIASADDEIDLLIVDIAERDLFDRGSELGSIDRQIPVVTAGSADAPQGSEYHIKGMLLTSRVIRVLDQVAVAAEGGAASEESALPVPAVSIDRKSHVYTVLVIDDSELMRKSVALELAKTSIPVAVDFAENGEQALEKVARQSYDFIFLDVMMPGIDGYETCAEIRKIAAMKRTPIIMLSAKTSPLDEVKGIMSGCTSYITKPIESDEFQNMLGRIMDWLGNYKKTAG